MFGLAASGGTFSSELAPSPFFRSRDFNAENITFGAVLGHVKDISSLRVGVSHFEVGRWKGKSGAVGFKRWQMKLEVVGVGKTK